MIVLGGMFLVFGLAMLAVVAFANSISAVPNRKWEGKWLFVTPLFISAALFVLSIWFELGPLISLRQ